ncbi:MAG: cytochrome c [Paracoccaceae bacterium]|nr:cytochrome c [Paracoccaceae bacterium]
MPALSAEAAEGERYFNAVCAACHGQNGLGTDQGPPLIHDIYNPGHHADEAFFRAANSGVPQHHWPFGNMPPQNLTQGEVARIIAYIREVQAANGITYRPHNM